MNSRRLPEIPEAEAKGETELLYHSIRSTLGVPGVNLIYRYFATFDHVLPWAWSLLQPYFADGSLQARAAQLTELFRHHASMDIDSKERNAIRKLYPADLKQISDVLGFYLRANPINLFALRVLVRHLRAKVPPPAFSPAAVEKSEDVIRVSALNPQQMDEQTRARVDRLSMLITKGDSRIVPTLFRHLANWPSILIAFEPLLTDRCRSAKFDRDVAALVAYSDSLALTLPTQDLINDGALSLGSIERREIGGFCRFFPTILLRMTLLAYEMKRVICDDEPSMGTI